MKKIRKNNIKLLIAGGLFLICLMIVGYAAFQTDLFLSVSGTTKKLYTSDSIRKMASNSDSLMTDAYGNIRYTGGSVSNYICLVDESPCQDKHLFRIIGSFKNISNGTETKTRVKLIKASGYALNYFDSSSNDWSNSNANALKINSSGFSESSLVSSGNYILRPTLFLKVNTFLITADHDGSYLNPYIIKLDD